MGINMFRMWCKLFKQNRLLADTVVCNDTSDTRTHKIFQALSTTCLEFNLAEPQWLDTTINDFKRFRKARFTQDNFIEEIDFDYLEIEIIEE